MSQASVTLSPVSRYQERSSQPHLLAAPVSGPGSLVPEVGRGPCALGVQRCRLKLCSFGPGSLDQLLQWAWTRAVYPNEVFGSWHGRISAHLCCQPDQNAH